MRELRTIVLASASPRRRELLASLGLRVLVLPSNLEEGARGGLSPAELAAFHASAKADAARTRAGRNLFVAADTVVDRDGVALGKPRDPAEAVLMLRSLGGRDHLVHTAFVVHDGATGKRIARTSTTRVWFWPLLEAEIEAYVASGDPFDKAGGYGIQGRGAVLVERIDGDFYTVMGLGLGPFVRALGELGFGLPHDAQAVAAERGVVAS
jgi:septum formation protein